MIDANGLIVQQDGDGGDSLANCASWNICQAITRGTDYIATEPCEIFSGVWVRNPDKTKWYSDPRTTSRDQLIGPIILAGLTDTGEGSCPTTPFFFHWLKRLGFAQNYKSDDLQSTKLPDLMWFQLGLFIRSYRATGLYPVLFFTDLNLLTGAIADCRPWRDPNDVDDRNAILQHAQAKLVLPTPVSWLACKIWLKWRPMNNGVAVVPNSHPIVQAVAWYFRPESGAHPGFIPLWQKMLKQVFGID